MSEFEVAVPAGWELSLGIEAVTVTTTTERDEVGVDAEPLGRAESPGDEASEADEAADAGPTLLVAVTVGVQDDTPRFPALSVAIAPYPILPPRSKTWNVFVAISPSVVGLSSVTLRSARSWSHSPRRSDIIVPHA